MSCIYIYIYLSLYIYIYTHMNKGASRVHYEGEHEMKHGSLSPRRKSHSRFSKEFRSLLSCVIDMRARPFERAKESVALFALFPNVEGR